MRAEGIPMLALFEQLNLFKKLQGKPARDAAKPDSDVVFTRVDPEIDDIRNGHVDTGGSVAGINSLKASFLEFYQIKFMEDNQANHHGNVHRFISIHETYEHNPKHQPQWLKQQFACKQFDLLNVCLDPTSKLATCHCPHRHRPDKGGRSSSRQREAAYCQGAEVSFCCRESGGPEKEHVPRMLIEFCCSEDSKLSSQRTSSEDCHCIRVTEGMMVLLMAVGNDY